MGDEFCSCNIVHDNIIEMVKQKMPQEEKLYDLAELFKVFGDTTRVKIISALFEAARQVVQEDKQVSEPGKKPSVLAMLHAPAPSRSEKTAQTKSAERDLI